MPRRRLTGTVVSDKSDKTVVVRVERKVKHPLYQKIIRRSKKYHAHDEHNQFSEGQIVTIEETAPFSKLKTWQVIAITPHRIPKEKTNQPSNPKDRNSPDGDDPSPPKPSIARRR